MIHHNQELDSTAFRKKMDAQKASETIEKWATGEVNPLTEGSEYVQGTEAPGPRQIPHGTPLTADDEKDIQEGKAVVAPPTIPANKTDHLSDQQLRDLASGAATLGAPVADKPGEYATNRRGELEIPRSQLQKALDDRTLSLEDIARGDHHRVL